MKIVMLNTSPHQRGCTNRGLEEMGQVFARHGIQWEILWIGSETVFPCRACNACRKLGKCVQEDAVNRLAPKLLEADGIVFASPVHYAAASGTATAFLDRLFYTHASALSGKVAACMVSCRRGGSSAALDQLNKYPAFAGMPLAAGQYWNMIHGTTPEEVEEDREGLQNLRTLAANMAWLLFSIEAGREKGLRPPERATAEKTNFIR